MIITRTPFRVSFLGGGSDYPAHYAEHGGAVLGMAIDKYCYVSLRHLPAFFEHKHRVVYSTIELAQRIAEIRHPAVRGVLKAYLGDAMPGVELHHDADLPARSGMGSSSSFVVGLINAVLALRGIELSAYELARRAITIEQNDMAERVGCQDQIFAAHGGVNLVRFGPGDKYAGTKIHADVAGLERHVLLFYTGVQRIAHEAVKGQMDNINNNVDALNRLAELAVMGADAMASGDLETLGIYVDESWSLKRSLASDVSNDNVNNIISAGLSAGAFGGKLLGAGTGGFVMFIVPSERQDAVCEALRRLILVRVKVDHDGSKVMVRQ